MAEQDFRFYEAHDVGDWLTRLAEVPAGRPGINPRGDQGPARNAGGPAETSAGPAAGGWHLWEAPSKRGTDGEACHSLVTAHRQEIKDLVIIATQAKRRKHGNLVWYSWVSGGRGRKAHPGHGSSLLGLDRVAAIELAAELHELGSDSSKWPFHFDLWLLQLLRKWETVHREAASQSPGQRPVSSRPGLLYLPRASYVFPSVGGYCSHRSGCDPKSVGGDGTRGMNWNDFGVQEGVRPQDARGPFVTAKDWQVERELLQFVSKSEKGERQPVEGGALRFPEPSDGPHDWTYFTERAPTRWDAPCEMLRNILGPAKLGWVNDSGQWLGPLGQEGLWRWQNWRDEAAWRTGRPCRAALPEKIQTEPNGMDDPVLGSPNDLANFMRLIVVDWLVDHPASRWWDMQRREHDARKRALAFYRGRSFRGPGEPAREPEHNHRPPRGLFFLRFVSDLSGQGPDQATGRGCQEGRGKQITPGPGRPTRGARGVSKRRSGRPDW